MSWNQAAEIPFTYGVFVKTKEDAEKIKKASEKFNISLSIHAPYWINLNSLEKEKVEKSKQRILECCKIGELIGVKKVVFHAGFYGEDSIEKTYEEIKKIILELLETISENKWKIKIAPEIMGKKNVFGSIDEINKLVVETGCDFCIDFAHVLARYGNYNFEEIKEKFGKI
jgi:deoxyribonuclease-4